MSESRDFSEYPEVVDFEGVGNNPLKHIHLIALSLVGLGVVFSILAPPGGYIALAIFILLAAGYDLFFLRRSQKPVTVTLYLRKDPVEATHQNKKLGSIESGSIISDMDDPRVLGFRATPKSRLVYWEFRSEEDAKMVSKRLLEYLQKEE